MAEARRDNNIGPLRLGFALLILLGHACRHSNGPEWPAYGAQVALQGFFYLSGYLVTESSRRWPFWPFAFRRVLRLWPGFVVAAIGWGLVFGLAPLGDVLSMGASDTLAPAWTLRWEMGCYALDAMFWYFGLARDRRVVLALAVAATVLLFVFAASPAPANTLPNAGPRFAASFLWGSVSWLYREKLKFNGWVAAACFALIVASGLYSWAAFRVAGVLAGAYLTSYLSFRTPLVAQWMNRTDLTYGVYLHHWPAMLLILSFIALPWYGLALGMLAVSLPLAALSWFLVERPSLAMARAFGLSMRPRASVVEPLPSQVNR